MSLIQNKDFKYSIQIPTFLSHEKCDELIEQITNTEQKVVGGVGGEGFTGGSIGNVNTYEDHVLTTHYREA